MTEKSLIAPHFGMEITLLRSGEKPAARIGRHEGADVSTVVRLCREGFYVIPYGNEDWLIGKNHTRLRMLGIAWDRLREVHDAKCFGRKCHPSCQFYHAKIGFFLGYPKEAIAAFLSGKYTNWAD